MLQAHRQEISVSLHYVKAFKLGTQMQFQIRSSSVEYYKTIEFDQEIQLSFQQFHN